MDIYPTLVELTGFEKPSHLDGQSLVPQIKNPNASKTPVISSYQFTWTDKPFAGHAVRSKTIDISITPTSVLRSCTIIKLTPTSGKILPIKKSIKKSLKATEKYFWRCYPNSNGNRNSKRLSHRLQRECKFFELYGIGPKIIRGATFKCFLTPIDVSSDPIHTWKEET